MGSFKNDGHVTAPVTGRHFNNDDTQALRGKMDFHPSDAFNAILEVDYTHQNTDLTMGQPTAPLESTDLATGATTVLLEPITWDFHAQTSFAPGKGQKLVHKGVALHMDWHLDDDWAFKSITAHRKLDTAAYIDIDASPLQLGDVSYRSTMWLSVDNRPGLMQPSYTLVGLFGVFDSADGHWQVRAGVRNLTNKTYKTDAQEFSSVGNIQTAYYGWPRNSYVSARYNF